MYNEKNFQVLSNFCYLLYYSLLFIEFSSTINLIIYLTNSSNLILKPSNFLFSTYCSVSKNNNDSVSLSNPIYIMFLISDFFNKYKTTPTSSFISLYLTYFHLPYSNNIILLCIIIIFTLSL